MEGSHRDLLKDMAEHRPILKNNQNTYHPRLGFTPKTRRSIPQNRVLFSKCRLRSLLTRTSERSLVTSDPGATEKIRGIPLEIK